MPPSIHLVATFRAKAGQEEALKTVLTSLVAPTRRELGCIRYDLLQSMASPAEFCFIERCDSQEALDQHVASQHITSTLPKALELADEPPQGRRYLLV